LGYQAAFAFDHRIGGLADRLRISRVRVSEHVSEDRFSTILSGAHPWLHHALGRQ
jgi:hypothetical protein